MNFLRLTITLLILHTLSHAFASNSTHTPLVETEWLASQPKNVVVLDVRTSKKSFVSKPMFNKNQTSNKPSLLRVGGHIPGARLVLYKNVRGDRLIDGNTIKHMVVTREQFETLMQQVGVNQDSHVIITTNAESGFDLTMASRMYWQMKYFGHDKVSILNGGTAQWLIDGRDIETSLENHTAGNWQASTEESNLFASSDDVQSAIENDAIQLVDVRPLGQYLGTFKSGKAKAKGHIPSAKAFPVDLISTRTTPVKFSPVTELKKLSSALSIDDQKDVITYCNSGHMASGGWFVYHEILGNKNVKLYDGSMHQWTLEDRPVVSMVIE